MYYEITTTDGLTIVQEMDRHHIDMDNVVNVSLMGRRVAIVSNLKTESLLIDFDKGVYLNGVLQTKIYDFWVALVAMTQDNTFIDTFTNADLVLNVLTENHNLNANVASTHIFNNLGEEVTGQYTPTKVTNNQLTCDFGGAIAGTWTIVIRKES